MDTSPLHSPDPSHPHPLLMLCALGRSQRPYGSTNSCARGRSTIFTGFTASFTLPTRRLTCTTHDAIPRVRGRAAWWGGGGGGGSPQPQEVPPGRASTGGPPRGTGTCRPDPPSCSYPPAPPPPPRRLLAGPAVCHWEETQQATASRQLASHPFLARCSIGRIRPNSHKEVPGRYTASTPPGWCARKRVLEGDPFA